MAGTGTRERASDTADDRALLDALRAGDESVFASIVDGWSVRCSGWRRCTSPRTGRRGGRAGDVARGDQGAARLPGAVVAAHLGLPDPCQPGQEPWRAREARRPVREPGIRLRRRARRGAVRFQGPGDKYPGGWREFPAEWPEQAALSREMHAVVNHALDTLPPRQRIVVALRDLEGHSAEEVSDLLDISTGNQRVLLHRGRSVVRAHLERYFSGAPAGRAR